jgi:hypothetical protein
LSVENNATLTIEPGVTIRFTQSSSGINIRNNSTLKAEGTDAKHIRLIGPTTNKGSWRGVQIESTTPNVLKYVDILHAGSEDRAYGAALYFDNGKADINNCLIDASFSNGITMQSSNSELLSFGNNVISNCGKAPVYTQSGVGAYSLRLMENNNSFTNNANAYIHISDDLGNNSTKGDMTLPHLNGYPWYFESGFPVGSGAVQAREFTIEPGAVLLMGSATSITVNGNSHLIAKGTAQRRITIKGFSDQKGYWQGILVESQTPGTIFDYCDISNGGRNRSFEYTSGIVCYGHYTTYLEIYNTKLSKSLTHGLTFYYSSTTANTGSSCYLKHANVTFSEIEKYVFFISYPSQIGYNSLPTMGSGWWRY